MATLDQQIEQSVEQVNADTAILHNIVHGTQEETITTDNGEVPTIAKVVKDNQDILASSISNLTTLHDEVETNKNIVAEDKTDVETIKSDVQSLRDEMATIFNNVGDSIGQFAFFASEIIPDGWLRCDGSTINKATYPDLVAYLNNGDELAESAVLPNAIHADGRGRFLRDIGLNGSPLDIQEDTLQNITGTVRGGDNDNNYASGAFNYVSTYHASIQGGGNAQICDYSFDASNVARTSDETRPLSLFGVLCIKAFHGVMNTGNIDTTGLASDTQSNTARVELLEDLLEQKGNNTTLWEGSASSGTITLTEPITSFTSLDLMANQGSSLYSTVRISVNEVLNNSSPLFISILSNWRALNISTDNINITSGTGLKLVKVIGIK